MAVRRLARGLEEVRVHNFLDPMYCDTGRPIWLHGLTDVDADVVANTEAGEYLERLHAKGVLHLERGW